jgi:hypothetical protein
MGVTVNIALAGASVTLKQHDGNSPRLFFALAVGVFIRQAIIRRADLGAAGIYYRALVGPFASVEKAAKLCSGLKAVGGDCIILKN